MYKHITLFTTYFLVPRSDSVPVTLIASRPGLEQHGAQDAWEPLSGPACGRWGGEGRRRHREHCPAAPNGGAATGRQCSEQPYRPEFAPLFPGAQVSPDPCEFCAGRDALGVPTHPQSPLPAPPLPPSSSSEDTSGQPRRGSLHSPAGRQLSRGFRRSEPPALPPPLSSWKAVSARAFSADPSGLCTVDSTSLWVRFLTRVFPPKARQANIAF